MLREREVSSGIAACYLVFIVQRQDAEIYKVVITEHDYKGLNSLGRLDNEKIRGLYMVFL